MSKPWFEPCRAGEGMKIVVAGGGISGLTAAHFLKKRGHDVIVVEPADRVGGVLRSDRIDGFLCEGGAQSILSGEPETSTLIADLDLGSEVEEALPAAQRRYVYWQGKLRAVPAGPWSLLTTDLLSWGGKLRLLREKRVPVQTDHGGETVFDFAERRLGIEVAERLVAAVSIGIFAGDARQLELVSAFPKMAALESEYGGLFRGMAARKKQGFPIGKSFSFRDGIETLPRRLAARLGDGIKKARVVGLSKNTTGWSVAIEARDGQRSQCDADRVVFATPGRTTASLVADFLPEAAYLAAVPIAPAVVVSLGFHKEGPKLDAFGFLVARGQGIDLLGCQYETATFTGRAPQGGTLLRCVRGGVFEPQVTEEDDATIIARTLSDLKIAMRLTVPPDLARVWRVREAIPQYRLGHDQAITTIETAAKRTPGLHILGNALRGAGVKDCIRNAALLAHGMI